MNGVSDVSSRQGRVFMVAITCGNVKCYLRGESPSTIPVKDELINYRLIINYMLVMVLSGQ